jgi:hypothetical protein
MFALVRQVQIATDLAKNGSARLADVDAPPYEDNETTMDELKTRIARTVAYLKTLDPKQIDASADREIAFPLGPTNKGHMKGASRSFAGHAGTVKTTTSAKVCNDFSRSEMISARGPRIRRPAGRSDLAPLIFLE